MWGYQRQYWHNRHPAETELFLFLYNTIQLQLQLITILLKATLTFTVSQFSVFLNVDEKKMMYFVSHQWKMKAKCDTIRTINNFLSDKISPFHRGASRKFNTHQVLTGEPTFKAFQKMFWFRWKLNLDLEMCCSMFYAGNQHSHLLGIIYIQDLTAKYPLTDFC